MSSAVAVFRTDAIQGEVVASARAGGVHVMAMFTRLPPGPHGFHIHKAGDLRGEGCMGLCEHYDKGHHCHGGAPSNGTRHKGEHHKGGHHKGERHTGDLGNIELRGKKLRTTYFLKGVSVQDLWGRSIIVHEDKDDLGKGTFEDSSITGHSGKRIGCAIFGRAVCTRKRTSHQRRHTRR